MSNPNTLIPSLFYLVGNRYIQLPFGLVPTGDMFQGKMDELFHGLPNVFVIADDILAAGFNYLRKDHDATLDKVLRLCRKANLKLNKDKCLFRCTSIAFFGEIISRHGVSPNLRKVQVLVDMPPPKSKKGIADIPDYSQLPEKVLTNNCWVL